MRKAPKDALVDTGLGRVHRYRLASDAEAKIAALSAALAASEQARGKAEAERLTLAMHIARPYSPEAPNRNEALRLAERVVKEGGNDGKS